MKKIILTALMSIAFGVTNAQVSPVANMNKQELSQIEKSFQADKDFTPEQIGKMEKILQQHNYPAFYEYVKTVNVSGNKYISYLNSKKDEGHIPLYWLMADYYSKQKGKEEETHLWYYIAIIMTQQDSYLCYDNTAKYATEKLSRAFPQPLDVIRRTPQYTDSAMRRVAFFISNMKHRITPEWVCIFGTSPVNDKNDVLIPSQEWAAQRKAVFERHIKGYAR